MGLHFEDAPARLASILQAIEAEPLALQVLADLRAMGAPLIATADDRSPPRAGSPAEIAAVGVYILDCSKAGQRLFAIAMQLGIEPPYSTNSLQALSDEPVRRFIIPALEYIDEAVARVASPSSLDALVASRQALILGAGFRAAFPTPMQSIERITGQFASASSDTAWNDIGNSVRSMLIGFARELRMRFPVSDVSSEPEANVKGIVRSVIRTHLDNGRFADSLVDLLASSWDHAQSLIHRTSSTRADAERCFIFAGLVASELYTVLLGSPHDA